MDHSKYSKLNVLAVDDFKQFLNTLTKMLQDFGCNNIDTATDVNQAVKFCENKNYDLILCDYNLGENKRNGRDFLEFLRRNNINTVFVLITAETSKDMVIATYDSNPDYYLVKPFNSQILKQRLDKLLVKREKMNPIHEAIKQQNYEDAVAHCKSLIEKGSRYSTECQKLLAEIFIKTRDFELADQVYDSVLAKRPLEWAVLGKAHLNFFRERYEDVIEALDSLIATNPNCLSAYDLLAEAHNRLGKSETTQKILIDVTSRSPLSILRQQHLGEIAEYNRDLETASNAYLRTVQLGKNSIHDRVENHLSLGRAVSELLTEQEVQDENLINKTLAALGNLNKRKDANENIEALSLLIQSEISEITNNSDKAKELIALADTIIEKNSDIIDLETKLELTNALSINGQKQRAKKELDELVKKHQDDESVLARIDKYLDTPVSNENKQKVAKINKEGIGLYDKKKYLQSIRCFEEATRLFPKHIGLHLNLTQAALGELKENEPDPELLNKCMRSLKSVASTITESHDQYSRYKKLLVKARELENTAKLKAASLEER